MGIFSSNCDKPTDIKGKEVTYNRNQTNKSTPYNQSYTSTYTPAKKETTYTPPVRTSSLNSYSYSSYNDSYSNYDSYYPTRTQQQKNSTTSSSNSVSHQSREASTKINQEKKNPENSSVKEKNSEPDFVPYEGILGKWLPRLQYDSSGKTFGYFVCDSCHKTWMSAHSKRDYKQACKDCKVYIYPSYLWKNDSSNYQKKKKGLEDKKKPHRQDLCEACKKGMCDYYSSTSYNTQYRNNDYNYYDDD